MKKYEHFYFVYNNKCYDDFTLYVINRTFPDIKEYSILMDSNYDHILSYRIDNSVANSPVPKNSSVYVAPDCPYAIDDIRKYYTIKRDVDTGDYNIIGSYKSHRTWLRRTKSMWIWPEKKLAFLAENRSDFYYLCPSDASVVLKTVIYSFYYQKASIYKKIIDNTLQKPLHKNTDLNINSSNELTLDILLMTDKLGSQQMNEESLQNFIVQLNLLNQHNWREYIGTVQMLFSRLFDKRGIYYTMRNMPSKYSKVIREFLKIYSHYPNFCSEKDFLMGRAFLDSLLNIGTCKYASLTDLEDKLSEKCITEKYFNELYNTVIKITPRKYPIDEKKD